MYSYNEIIRFKCSEGFNIQGDQNRKCTGKETFRPPFPNCTGMEVYFVKKKMVAFLFTHFLKLFRNNLNRYTQKINAYHYSRSSMSWLSKDKESFANIHIEKRIRFKKKKKEFLIHKFIYNIR